MTRTICFAILALACSVSAARAADESGLYQGSGRIRDYSWAWRANGSVGFQGIEDPWDQFGVNSFPIAGYTNFGLEVAIPGQQSLEINGGYYWVHDSQSVVASGGGPPDVPRPGTYSYEVSAWSVGGTWRFHRPGGSNAAYLGVGGGWVFGSHLAYSEEISGSDPYQVRASGSGPQVNFGFGYDGIPDSRLRVGMELGFRYSWADFDNGIYGAGNFNGIYLGFRLGIVKTP